MLKFISFSSLTSDNTTSIASKLYGAPGKRPMVFTKGRFSFCARETLTCRGSVGTVRSIALQCVRSVATE